jgi:hypothetical protein
MVTLVVAVGAFFSLTARTRLRMLPLSPSIPFNLMGSCQEPSIQRLAMELSSMQGLRQKLTFLKIFNARFVNYLKIQSVVI